MHFSSSLPLITVEPLACLSSTSPFSSSLTALLLLTNLIDLDNLNVTSPASFISLMRRGLQPQGARLMWENECRWNVIGCFVAVVVVVYKKWSPGCSWSQLTVERLFESIFFATQNRREASCDGGVHCSGLGLLQADYAVFHNNQCINFQLKKHLFLIRFMPESVTAQIPLDWSPVHHRTHT